MSLNIEKHLHKIPRRNTYIECVYDEYEVFEAVLTAISGGSIAHISETKSFVCF